MQRLLLCSLGALWLLCSGINDCTAFTKIPARIKDSGSDPLGPKSAKKLKRDCDVYESCKSSHNSCNRSRSSLKVPLEETEGCISRLSSPDGILKLAICEDLLGSASQLPLVQDCGPISAADIYTPAVSKARFALRHPPSKFDYSMSRIEFQEFVHKARLIEKLDYERASRKLSGHLGLTIVTWNALNLLPSSVHMAYPFLANGTQHDVNATDIFVCFLQENTKYPEHVGHIVLNNLAHILNTLSRTKNWKAGMIYSMNNRYGTSLNITKPANTQTAIVVIRSSVELENPICPFYHSISKREKGLVGYVIPVKGLGPLAVVGIHYSGWSGKYLMETLPTILNTCVPNADSKGDLRDGLKALTGGVYVAGDWNEHINTRSLKSLTNIVQSDPVMYSDIAKQASSKSPITALAAAFLTPLKRFDSIYTSLMWNFDRLGRHHPEDKDPLSMLDALYSVGFRKISICYRAGFTYKYNADCLKNQTSGPETGYSVFSAMQGCLAPKVYESNRGGGYLDRLAWIPPAKGRRISSPHSVAMMKTASAVYVGGSDHILMAHSLGIAYKAADVQ